MLALRFANGLYEPIWNRDNVEYVQIDVPETLSIGSAAGFYEGTGAYRDMIVRPVAAAQLRRHGAAGEPRRTISVTEKMKVFEAVESIEPGAVSTAGRGLSAGGRGGARLRHRDLRRGQGRDRQLALGRAPLPADRQVLRRSRRLVALDFREPPMRMFPGEVQHQGADHQLVFEFAEPGEITADFQAKVPGPTMELGAARMTFRYAESFCGDRLEAYERLIHDAMIGDATLFTRADGIERLWEVSTPALEDPGPVVSYPKGSWGPKQAEELAAPYHWRLPE